MYWHFSIDMCLFMAPSSLKVSRQPLAARKQGMVALLSPSWIRVCLLAFSRLTLLALRA